MDDGEIIKLFWCRDEQALEQTRNKYGAKCFAVAYGILRNRQDAEETVSDAYLTLWSKIPPDRPAVFCAYLYKTVRNLALLRYNSEKTDKRRVNSAAAPLSEIDKCLPAGSDLESQYDVRELSGIINRFLYGLPERDRGMFVCRYFMNMEHGKIARKYACSVGTVKMSVHRTKQKLKETLKKEGYYSEK